MKKTLWMMLPLAVFVFAFAPSAHAAPAKQTATQALRSQSASANGAKRSFEIDLSKYAPKDATSQRTAKKVQRQLNGKPAKKTRKVQSRKRVSRDQKNYGALNR